MRNFGIACALMLVVIGLGVGARLLWVAMLPVHALDNGIQAQHDIIDKTINADNELRQYHWFKQQHEDILAIENKIQIAHDSLKSFESDAGDRKDWTFEDKTEDSRLRAVEQGLMTQREQMIADYNAKSKEADVSIFKDGLFPRILETGAGFLK